MILSPHERPSPGISHLLIAVNLALVLVWCANVILVAAAWLSAFDAEHMPTLFGASALLTWIFLLGWLGWRSQFHRPTK